MRLKITFIGTILLCACNPLLPEQTGTGAVAELAASSDATEQAATVSSASPVASAPTSSTTKEQAKSAASEKHRGYPESCAAVGGTIRTERKPPRGTFFNVCLLPEGRQCEEQALLSGACPSNGIRLSAYRTPAARYCVITGGRYTMTSTEGEEQGTCAMHGKTCDVWALWDGTCTL